MSNVENNIKCHSIIIMTWTYRSTSFLFLECPTEPIQLSGNGSFSSLNYPIDNYPSERNCFWIITASVSKRVKVEINDFNMGNCDDCSGAFCSRVEFFDGQTTDSPYLGRFCTGSSLTAVVSNGTYMLVKFYSSNSRDRGFRAEYVESFDESTPTQTPPPTTPTTAKPPTTGMHSPVSLKL